MSRLEEIKENVKGHEKELPNAMWLINRVEELEEFKNYVKFLLENPLNAESEFKDLKEFYNAVRGALKALEGEE